jgi:O-antigen/teichoic acid export membrane protein
LNAARGIATTVNGAVAGFAANFMMALNPQITKTYAAGEMQLCHSLVCRGSRFSFFILFLFALPLFLEAEFVLTLWLKQYPPHTINFVRLILLLSMIDILSNTLINLQTATGRIRNYQLVVGGVLLLNFPFSYICLYIGFPPESTLVVAIIIAICCMILRLIFLRRMAKLPVGQFIHEVIFRILTVAFLSSIIPCLLHMYLSYGWQRFLLVGAISVLCCVINILYVGCTKNERTFILQKVVQLKQKIFK